MRPRDFWPQDLIFIEIGVTDANVALGLREEGFSKYLGVAASTRRIDSLRAKHPEVSEQLTSSQRPKLVLNNNADVLILSGRATFSFWRFQLVRHANCVAWRCGFHPLSLVALVCCLLHAIAGRCELPRIVTLGAPGGKRRRLFATRILRQKNCYRKSLHFIPHVGGLRGLFRQFDQQCVRYVVLRWFEHLPELGPEEDVDVLVADESLSTALSLLHALPGIQPCDLYSESGLALSLYRGTPYYPPHIARRILAGAERHKDLCSVPGLSAYFHSLAYHAVYHKGERSGLPCRDGSVRPRSKSGHDYAAALTRMARQLGIDADISLNGLHDYLQASGWGPSSESLARLAAACRPNRWLQVLARRLDPHVHDQGLIVFVLREQAVSLGYRDQMISMIEQGGFEILAAKDLSPAEVELSAARTRGGNWTPGPFEAAGGPPAVCVVAYDRAPLPMSRRQQRKFPHRTNARIFVKETIRDAILAELPPNQGCNALHSSDHAAEAWHLIEVFAPELVEAIKSSLSSAARRPAMVAPALRRAA